MPDLEITYDQGVVTSRDRADLRKGELQTGSGIYYKPGDPKRPWVLPARTAFGDTGTGAVVKGIALCQFDSGGTDKLVALSGTALYGATPGLTGTFASLETGMSASATTLSAAHMLDRWYLATGYDYIRCLESDGTVRRAGMVAPQVAPVITTGASAGTAYRPTATLANSGFTNPGNAWDADLETFAGGTLAAAGTATATFGTWAADATASRRLYIKYRLAGLQPDTALPESDGGGSAGYGIGGSYEPGFNVTIKIEVSENDGTGYTTVHENTRTTAMNDTDTLQHEITADSDQIRVRVTLTYNSGKNTATLQIYDVRIIAGASSTVSNFSTTTGIYYAFCEYNENAGIQGPLSPISKLTAFATKNNASIALPSAAQNSAATHWRIYRTADGGSAPDGLGLIGSVLIASTSFIDDFETWAYDEVPRPPYPLEAITYDTETYYIPRDAPPPQLVHINAYQGSLVGVSLDSPRSLSYSIAGRPESWPESNVIANFPLPERDELVATATVGDTLVIGAKGVMLALDKLPRTIQGIYDASEVRTLDGQPGLVGMKAICSFSLHGEPRAAWVSPFGIHVTNGHTAYRISDDIDWNSAVDQDGLSSAVLAWDHNLQALIFAYDNADGDRKLLILHMSEMHQKSNGMPKLTGPTTCSVHDMVRGLVASTDRVYTAHESDGKVYVNYATSVAASIKTGRIYADWRFWAALRGNLRHTAGGSSDTVSVVWTMGRDAPSTTQAVTKSVSIASHEGTEFLIARSGEWAEQQITYSGSETFGILDTRVLVQPMGKAGRVAT